MNGIVIVDKPQGWTSQDVTARLRRVFNTRRIGHGGTLDPMATGVLPVFVGRATRGVEFFEHAEKTYGGVLQVGITSDTEDVTGTVLEQRQVEVTEEAFLQILDRFRGEILQVPPMYSALKVDGQKLCDLARKGKEVKRKPRPITIHDIRTLCKDIGQALGCGGCMEALRRVRAGEYAIEEAVPLQELLDTAEPEKYLRTVDTMFRDLPSVTLTPNQEKRCRNGNGFSIALEDGKYRAYSQSGEFLMLAQVENGVMSTIKSFFEV